MTNTIEKWLITIASTLAICATVWSYVNGYILAYGDAESHLNIAKRVTDSITPGLAQLGGIWLPLPHLLLVPFTKLDILWSTGLAGSIVSGITYVVSSIFIYKITYLITQQKIASGIAFLVFVLNPNLLYMQSTAMTELPLIGFSVLSIYYFLRYLRESTNILLLVIAGFFGLCTTLTRYDGWFLVAAEVAILFIRAIPKGRVIMFATLALSGIIAWFGWDGLILGDPLYFTNSPFSAKSQQRGWLARGQLLTYQNLPLSLTYYSATAAQNIGIFITAIALLGTTVYLFDKYCVNRWETVAVLAIPFLFYVVTLYLGQSIILIPELTPQDFEWQMFNVRYGLPMVPMAAIMTGYLAYKVGKVIQGKILENRQQITTREWLAKMFHGLIIALIFFQTFLFLSGEQKVVVLEDGVNGLSSALRYHLDAQYWMRDNYNGGLVLLDDYARTVSVISSGIPMDKVIYVGNKPYWDDSMDEPEKHAQWIVIQKDDDIWKKIYERPEIQARLYKYFQKVYTSPDVLIFKRNTL